MDMPRADWRALRRKHASSLSAGAGSRRTGSAIRATVARVNTAYDHGFGPRHSISSPWSRC